jgi:hypothetical protein
MDQTKGRISKQKGLTFENKRGKKNDKKMKRNKILQECWSILREQLFGLLDFKRVLRMTCT